MNDKISDESSIRKRLYSFKLFNKYVEREKQLYSCRYHLNIEIKWKTQPSHVSQSDELRIHHYV